MAAQLTPYAITDCPQSLGNLFSQTLAYTEMPSINMPIALQKIWPVLGAAEPVFLINHDNLSLNLLNVPLIILKFAKGSQFDALRQYEDLTKEFPDGLAVVALDGQGFHGQHQRPWNVAPGNLYLTVTMPMSIQASENIAAAMMMMPVVAVADAMRSLGLRSGIKWVNDVFLDNAKVGGVLVATWSANERFQQALFGIGVNIESVPKISQSRFIAQATSLHEHGVLVKLGDFMLSVLTSLKYWGQILLNDGPIKIWQAYVDMSLIIGKYVSIWDEQIAIDNESKQVQKPLASGRVIEILPDLGLKLAGYDTIVRQGRLTLDE